MKNSKLALGSEWEFLFTFGYSLDIYAFGDLRVGIDKNTGEKVISYVK